MQIKVTFKAENIRRCVYRNYEGDEAVINEHIDSQKSLYNILIDFGNKQLVHIMISLALDCIDVDKIYHEQIITEIVRFVRSQSWENTTDSKEYCLDVNMRFISFHIHDERDVLQQSILEAQEDCETTPASWRAIRSLRRERIKVEDGDDATKCMVCLEDFCDGEKVMCMPCPHKFHRDCITKWLLQSHVCPVCRYEMPKACKA